jgi:hypothetical protein
MAPGRCRGAPERSFHDRLTLLLYQAISIRANKMALVVFRGRNAYDLIRSQSCIPPLGNGNNGTAVKGLIGP